MDIKLFLLLNDYEQPWYKQNILIFFNIYQGADLLDNVAILLKISEKTIMLFFRKGNNLSIFPLAVYEGSIFFPNELILLSCYIMMDEK